jgi:aldehyde:ferredoxin oxidoreductase
MEAGDRIYTLERYYNNLAGFDGADDSLPGRFVEGHDEAIPGQGAAEGDLCELDEMKQEYYDRRGWVDGVVPDERLDELGIDVGPGTGVSTGDSPAPADD